MNNKIIAVSLDEETEQHLSQRAKDMHLSKSSVIRLLLSLEKKKNFLLTSGDSGRS